MRPNGSSGRGFGGNPARRSRMERQNGHLGMTGPLRRARGTEREKQPGFCWQGPRRGAVMGNENVGPQGDRLVWFRRRQMRPDGRPGFAAVAPKRGAAVTGTANSGAGWRKPWPRADNRTGWLRSEMLRGFWRGKPKKAGSMTNSPFRRRRNATGREQGRGFVGAPRRSRDGNENVRGCSPLEAWGTDDRPARFRRRRNATDGAARGFPVGAPRRAVTGTAKQRCGVAKPWPRSGQPQQGGFA